MARRTSSEDNGDRVREILASSDELELLQERYVGGVLRTVSKKSDRFVIKRYVHAGGARPRRCPWVAENAALKRLRGLHAPEPIGFVEQRSDSGMTATLVRRYVAGEPVAEPDDGLAREMASLMAALHGRGVTTEDAHRHNFLRSAEGGLVFLDFGKARVFRTGSPLLYAGVAFELHRFFRAALGRDAGLWQIFIDEYQRCSSFGLLGRAAVSWLLRLETWRYRVVKGG
ncbi:MAG: lipopolysaccharide kinase InaA family protein [Chromatiales bacterium]|nr:lipopolysaccharide kinase InaA family protein [Chromatiales bacterium]